MKKTSLLAIGILFSLVSFGQTVKHLADYVNTSVGLTDKRYNNCVVGPRMPFSSISPSPQTPKGNMDCYNPSQPIMGFGQLHVSGTGWGSYGHFLISPQTGKLETMLQNHLSPHSQDVTKAYYYSTHLDRYNTRVELVPTHHSAIYRFTNDGTGDMSVLFDAAQSLATDIEPTMHGKVILTSTDINPDTRTIRMHLRYQGGWINGQYDVYCVAKCEQPFADWGTWHGNTTAPHQKVVETSQGDTLHAGAYCRVEGARQVVVKLAVSFVSCDRAEVLLNNEIPGWDFDNQKNIARQNWDKQLSKIEVETADDDCKTIFYSSLFRAFTAISDRTLDNPHDSHYDRPYYDDNYAYWDTYRSVYPLFMLVDDSVVAGDINTAIDIYSRDGNVTDGYICGRARMAEQGGNDIDHVIAEACLKNIPGVNWQKAYAIVKHHADSCRIGHRATVSYYRQMGYIPEGVMSSSQTLEFSYNDYSAALMAQKLGLKDDYTRYMKRSANWQNIWNPNMESRGYKGFIDARKKDGTFAFFNAEKYGGSWSQAFYEASPWTYSYYVPHDFKKLIQLMGGNKKFVERLDYGFKNNLVKYDNEPGFLAPFGFCHAGRPDKTSYWVRQLLKNGFDLTGYPGNDDTGSLASWYVFAAMGFFPNAGQDFYYLFAPTVNKAVLHLSNGKTLTIIANASMDNEYVKSCKFIPESEGAKKSRSVSITKPFINHSDIANGGTLIFQLSNQPTSWGK